MRTMLASLVLVVALLSYSAHASTCTVPTPSETDTTLPASIGAGIGQNTLSLYVSIPTVSTRTLVSITFDASATSTHDYPAASSEWQSTADDTNCKNLWTFTINPIDANIEALPNVEKTLSASSVGYSGALYVTYKETLPSSAIRTVTNKLMFDFTFPIETVSVSNVKVISGLGTVVQSTILQQTAADNSVKVTVAVQSHYPYRLNWVDKAAQGAFPGTRPITFSSKRSDASISFRTLSGMPDCASTSTNVACVQHVDFVIVPDPAVCNIDGTYTLHLAVDGCSDDETGESCLKKADGSITQTDVTVTLQLAFENLCGVKKIYTAPASALTVYANSALTQTKSRYIYGQDSTLYFKSTLIPSDRQAYQGFQITGVRYTCTSSSLCSGDSKDLGFTDNSGVVSSSTTTATFSVEMATLIEARDPTQANLVAYMLQATIVVYFSDNTKRTLTRNFNVVKAQGTVDSTAQGGFEVFVPTNNNAVAAPVAGDGTSSTIGIVGIIVGVVGFVGLIGFVIFFVVQRNKKKAEKNEVEVDTAPINAV